MKVLRNDIATTKTRTEYLVKPNSEAVLGRLGKVLFHNGPRVSDCACSEMERRPVSYFSMCVRTKGRNSLFFLDLGVVLFGPLALVGGTR
jgi:hypothetical protein